jgi:drug/metabolite transporter (DMT)-like permease
MFGVAGKFRPIVNRDTILLSLFTFTATNCWAYGLEYVPPAESAVLTFSMPLFSIPLSYVILSEKAAIDEWGGAVVGFVGVLVYSSALANQKLTVFGGILTLLNAFLSAMFIAYFRKLKNQDPTITVATQLLFVALISIVLAQLDYKLTVTPNFLFDLAYVSIPGGAGFYFLWNAMARERKIGKTTTLVYLVPVTATLVQIVQTSVIPDIVPLIGLALMILGLCLSNRTTPLHANSKQLRAKISKLI